MGRAVFTAIGVDYDQWKALTKVALKLDFRQTSLGSGRVGRSLKGGAALVSQLIFYTVMGAFLAGLVWIGHDLFLIGLVLTGYTFFIVGTAVLVNHNSALTSATDYAVLGFQPVSSRTYFAAKLTNVLVYTLGLTTAAVWLPAVAVFVRHGAAEGIGGAAAIYGTAIATSLVMLLGYAWMLRMIGADALKHALSYVQLLMSFAIYGGYFLMSGVLVRRMSALTIQKSVWLLLYPGAWFASYLDLAAGRWGAAEVVPSLASVGLIAWAAVGLNGRLSLGYAARLADMAATPAAARAAKPRRTRPGWWFRSGEARAMAVLVRSQFRNDQRFRMTVLGILPLTLVYVFLGVRNGSIVDPFIGRANGRSAFSLVAVAVMMFPLMLKMSLSRSESFRAAWIFFASPTDRIRIIRASTNVLVGLFLMPYLVFVAALYLYFVHNVWHVVLHILFLGLLSHLLLQVMVLVDPELPFSRPWQGTRNSSMTFGVMIAVFVVAGLLGAFGPAIYASVPMLAASLGVIVAASLIVDLLTRARVAGQTQSLEFEG